MPNRGPARHPRGHGHGHDYGYGHGHNHRDSPSHQQPIDYKHRELYLQICKEDQNTVHWMVFMKYPGHERGIRLHSTGCMGDRTLWIEDDKRFDSDSVESTHYLGTIHQADSCIVDREARKIPLQSCQLWACYLILRLERKGLLEEGNYHHFMHCYKHRMIENYGPGDDIHDCPVHGH